MTHLMKLDTIIPQIVANISFVEYLEFIGYQKKEKKLKGFECYQKIIDEKEDNILLSCVEGINIYYSLTHRDKGNIIDFVKNRIEIDNQYQTFEPEKDHLIEACSKLMEYIKDHGEKQINISAAATKSEMNYLIKNSFTKFYNAKDIEKVFNKDYYEYFNIDKLVLEEPLFKNKIYSTLGLILNKKIYKNAINVVFPLFDESNNECGLYNSNLLENSNNIKERVDFFVPGTNTSGVWISNKPNIHPNNKIKFTIVSEPIEALAHYSYFKEESRLYACLFDPTQTTYEIIKSNMNIQNCSLYLALSISMKNFENEIKLILSFMDVNMRFVKSTYDYLILSLSGTEEKYFENFIKKIKKLNSINIQKPIKVLGEDAKSHLQQSIILATADENNNLTILIPKNFKTLYQFEKLIIRTFPSKHHIIIEKPKYMNWKMQNKLAPNKLDVEKLVEEEQIFILNN